MDNQSEEKTWALMFAVFLLLLFAIQHSALAAEEKAGETGDAKTISGMSIIGNTEAPKSLFIVPWKSSEIGFETTLTSGLDDVVRPVDRDVFMRQIEFYEIRHDTDVSSINR